MSVTAEMKYAVNTYRAVLGMDGYEIVAGPLYDAAQALKSAYDAAEDTTVDGLDRKGALRRLKDSIKGRASMSLVFAGWGVDDTRRIRAAATLHGAGWPEMIAAAELFFPAMCGMAAGKSGPLAPVPC